MTEQNRREQYRFASGEKDFRVLESPGDELLLTGSTFYTDNIKDVRAFHHQVSRDSDNVPMVMSRDPGNEHDPFAIMVLAPTGEGVLQQVGWIPKRMTDLVAPYLDLFEQKARGYFSAYGRFTEKEDTNGRYYEVRLTNFSFDDRTLRWMENITELRKASWD